MSASKNIFGVYNQVERIETLHDLYDALYMQLHVATETMRRGQAAVAYS